MVVAEGFAFQSTTEGRKGRGCMEMHFPQIPGRGNVCTPALVRSRA